MLRSRTPAVVAAAAGLLSLPGLLVLDGRALMRYSDVLLTAVAAVATVALAARARVADERLKVTWAWNAAACGAWTAGQVAWSVLQLTGTDVPLPSVADVGFFLAMPLAALGVLSHPGVKGLVRGRSALDGALAAATTAVATWAVLLAFTQNGPDAGSVQHLLAVAHPVSYAALTAVIAYAAMRWEGVQAPVVAALAAAWGMLALASLGYGSLVVVGSYRTGHPVDAGYVVAFAALAAIAWRPPRPGPEVPGGRWRRGVAALPYLPLAAAVAALAFGGARVDAVLVVGVLVVLVLVITRQHLTLAENQALARELERRVADRTAALAASEARYRHALAGARVGSVELDVDDRTVHWSPEIEAMHGLAPGTFDGTLGAAHAFTHPADRELVERTYHRLAEGGEFHTEHRIVRVDGEVRWVETRASLRVDGGRRTIVGVVTDVTERKATEAELDRLAHTDALTGLPNRIRLFEALDRSADEDAPTTLLVMDLDGFKDVNDGLGHDLGDRFLVEVAARLRAGVRQGDLVARLGGDEFAVVLPGTGAAEDGIAVARQLLAALARPVEVAGLRLPVAASVGIACRPRHGTGAGDLLRHADVAMYRAKQRGGTWAVYGDDGDEDRTDRLSLMADLRSAIDDGEIDVHYQPQVELATGRIVAVEALARWHHPTRGDVAPAEFVAVAEHSGLIRDLTPLVLRTALEQCRRWRAEGFDVQVAVNVSPRQLHDPALVHGVDRALLEARLPPTALTVEITEGAFADEAPAVAHTLAALRALGVRLSVDDFGTGYSSLAYLKRLPVSEVKIDRSFIAGLPGHADTGIVRAVLELARHLGLTVVAEGVEEQAALDTLRAWGCTLAQGFLVGRPRPAAAVGELLARQSERPFSPAP